jgi:Domain of unknown function (DUF6456)
MSALSKPAALPTDAITQATLMWRRGQWFLQAPAAQAFEPASPRISAALDAEKKSGKLDEIAPGLFRFQGGVAQGLRDQAESPLTRLAALKQSDGRGLLDAAQLRAGERLRLDYERAHLSPRVTMRYEASGGNAGRQAQFSDNHIETLTDLALDARDKLHLALEAVGPELSGILLHVCCMAAGLEQAELRLSLPRRAGKAILQMALTRLSRHYGYKQHLHHAGPGHIGHWAVSDFRPQIAVPAAHQP